MKRLSVAAIALASAALLSAQPAPPRLHYAPDRTYHLVKTLTKFDVDAPKQRTTGSVVATISMLRDGISTVHFDTSAEKVTNIRVDGKPAKFTRNGNGLEIELAGGKRNAVHRLDFDFEGRQFRWTSPTEEEPNRIGFCAEGMGAQPIGWSAPNDLSSTEVEITVPAEWTVISNGIQVSDKPAPGKRHTVIWRLDQLHSGYLNSLAAGPFDVYRDTWRGKPLIMTCPKGMGDKLKSTFAPTKDILNFFSDVLDFPYPWPKYGQEVVYEHEGYAEEDVSATEYPIYWRNEGTFLTDDRDGMTPSAWVIAHETAHQWFGDTVTCKDWGDTWLNEGMATYMELAYTSHAHGPIESLRLFESYSRQYFNAGKTDYRPIATNNYSDSTGMGGWVTYMGGATVLDSLRKQLGDDAFYHGLSRYLAHRKFGNVESNDLCSDMSEASGINLHPWFDQWIYKPGHPVIAWDWSYDAARKMTLVHVRQTQDTSRGTPVYTVPTHIGLIEGQGVRRAAIELKTADQTFEIPSATAPKAVLFDPDHDFVREIPNSPWSAAELPAILESAPDPTSVELAMNRLLDAKPSDDVLRTITARLRRDLEAFPAIPNTSRLANLANPALHDFFLAETTHPNYTRRTQAATGFAKLATTDADRTRLHQLLGNDQPYEVVAAALRGLAALDFASVRDFATTQAATSPDPLLRRTSLELLAERKVAGWEAAILETATPHQRPLIRETGLRAIALLPRGDARGVASLRSGIASRDSRVAATAIGLVGRLKERALEPDLRQMRTAGKHVPEVDAALKALQP